MPQFPFILPVAAYPGIAGESGWIWRFQRLKRNGTSLAFGTRQNRSLSCAAKPLWDKLKNTQKHL